MPARIRFQPNEPVTLSLSDPQGEYDFELRVGRYQTTDGRELVLPREAVIKLNELAPAAGEEIGICKQAGEVWSVWLTASSEQARAEAETGLESPEIQSDTELLLEASLKRETGKKRKNGHPVPIRTEPKPALNPIRPSLIDRGTGTDGPLPQLAPAAIPVPLPALSKRPPDSIPWNVAFREVAKFVSAELAACNLQWSDEAQQAAVCTVLIAEVKKGRIGLWER
jgi:hypothetical protein